MHIKCLEIGVVSSLVGIVEQLPVGALAPVGDRTVDVELEASEQFLVVGGMALTQVGIGVVGQVPHPVVD